MKGTLVLCDRLALIGVARSYRNELTLYLLNKAKLNHHFRALRRKAIQTVTSSGCASLRQSLLSALLYNKTTIIQLYFSQI